MNILITGGNTQTPIDKVRVISNIFKGRTAIQLAEHCFNQGHNVTLLGNPDMKDRVDIKNSFYYKFLPYRTYDDLFDLMKFQIKHGKFDVIIHSAAVSDYTVAGTFVKDNGNLCDLDSSGKIASDHKELYLRLVPTKKIVDKIRSSWGFEGKLVKFKLQVDMSDEDLLEVASASRLNSKADFIVANCLEWAKEKAYILGDNLQQEVVRENLPRALLDVLEK